MSFALPIEGMDYRKMALLDNLSVNPRSLFHFRFFSVGKQYSLVSNLE